MHIRIINYIGLKPFILTINMDAISLFNVFSTFILRINEIYLSKKKKRFDFVGLDLAKASPCKGRAQFKPKKV